VYSSIYSSIETRSYLMELTATVSIRNLSWRYPVVFESVRYYDSAGKEVRQYLSAPSELPPLSTVEFVIPEKDTAGPGANFLVRWAASAAIDEPLIEAIMARKTGKPALPSQASAGC
jgi:uncharacterized protein DUF3124